MDKNLEELYLVYLVIQFLRLLRILELYQLVKKVWVNKIKSFISKILTFIELSHNLWLKEVILHVVMEEEENQFMEANLMMRTLN